MKRSIAVLAGFLVLALACQAQFIGYVSQQSVTATPFNNVTCTAALATGRVPITNIGQGAHFLSATVNGVQRLVYTIQGSYDGVNFFDISDDATNTVNSAGRTGITGTGYYPVVAASVSTCTPGTATVLLKYSGISLTPGTSLGTNQLGQAVKNIAVAAPANASIVPSPLRSPYGSSAGTLFFSFLGAAGPAGSTIDVKCGTNGTFLPVVFGPFALQTTASVTQFFPIPPAACNFFVVDFTSGGASTATFNLDYSFSQAAPSADICQTAVKQSQAVSVAAAATTEVIPAVATLAIHVCGYQVSQAATAGTLQWSYGTAPNCSVGPVTLTGAIPVTASSPIAYGDGSAGVFVIPIGNALCLTTTGVAGTAAGVVTYVAVPW